MGKVFIVGAGPGDPALLTLKAKEILKKADVVIYDHLIDKDLLNLCGEKTEKIYVGKKAGKHTLSQSEINDLLLKKAKEYKTVVRLKGGDPYIFGRGGEEAEKLSENEVDFEVVPGISAALAISSYTGIPLTHRKYASSVMFLTGHEDPLKEKSSIDWELLGKYRGTLVFFMGVKNLKNICNNLIQNGMDENTPSALVMWGTTCKQKSITSTLKNLPEDARKHGFSPPSLLIIGEVVKLKTKLNWFEKLPLMGKNVVITRAKDQAGDLKEKLAALGACCIEFPTIKIVPLKDYTALYQAIENLSDYQWIVFTSVNGVKYFFKELYRKNKDVRALGRVKVAAIGPATAKALELKGIVPDLIPKTYVAEEVAKELINSAVRGKKILIPRAKEAREVLIRMLEIEKAEVEVVPVYETKLENSKKEDLIDLIEKDQIEMITFTSSSTVKNFFKLIPSYVFRNKRTKFACIGPVTASTLKDFGFEPDVVAKEHTIEGLVNEIKEYFAS